MKRLDIKPGDRFGRWTVLDANQHLHGRKPLFSYCVCDCGNVGFVQNNYLVSGHSTSCGCHRHDSYMGSQNNLAHTKTYNVWHGMLGRCFNTNNPAYKNYGGRGITVCDEWRNDFSAFHKWAIENGCNDSEELTLDRIDNNGNYCPENCKWSTHEEQSNNKRNNVYWTYNGKTQSLSQWIREFNMPSSTVFSRIDGLGWSIERALTEPIHNTQPYKRKKVLA